MAELVPRSPGTSCEHLPRQDNKDEVEIASLAAARNSAPSLRAALPLFPFRRFYEERVCLGGPKAPSSSLVNCCVLRVPCRE